MAVLILDEKCLILFKQNCFWIIKERSRLASGISNAIWQWHSLIAEPTETKGLIELVWKGMHFCVPFLMPNSSVPVQGAHPRFALEGAKGPGLSHGNLSWWLTTHGWPKKTLLYVSHNVIPSSMSETILGKLEQSIYKHDSRHVSNSNPVSRIFRAKIFLELCCNSSLKPKS